MMKTFRLPALIVLFFTLQACSIVEHRNDVSFGETGQLVSEKLLAQIEPGKTKRPWVISYLGEPTSSKPLGGGEELLTYSYDTVSQKKLRVILVFQTRSTQVESKRVFVRLKDGVVARYWTDFSYPVADAPEEDEEPR